MSGGSPRRVRVAEAIKQDLGELIHREVSDPRVGKAGLLSVTQVELNRDMSVAQIYVSFVGSEDREQRAAVRALEGAAGYLRGLLGRRLGLARAPELRFRHDRSAEFQARMREIVLDDEARRSSAQPASEAAAEDGEEDADD